MAGMWSRVTGRGATAGNKTLVTDLKKVTHSGVLDIPKELMTPIIEACNSAQDRPEIMKHLRECLAEPAGKHWKRIHGALLIVEALLKNGCPDLMMETAEGRHFDLVQRLSFLEVFDFNDKRVQSMVRTKAEALRKEVVPLIQNAGQGQNKQDGEESVKDTCSTCSPAAISESTRTSTVTSTSLGFGSDDVASEIPKIESETSRRMVLNGIVSVGHNDDTTSEEECESKARAPVEFREPKRASARERNARSRQAEAGDSSDSDSNGRTNVKVQSTSPPAAQSVNLLDF